MNDWSFNQEWKQLTLLQFTISKNLFIGIYELVILLKKFHDHMKG